ncbi:MAG: hypothetical protein HYX41_05970 [Bdellovibrio sp.]|nr:hypothetical protein [Bdellovibrio sp.]
MKNRISLLLLSGIVGFVGITSESFALDQIIRPYQSVRSAGMGGMRMSTGLYDIDRVAANPNYGLINYIQGNQPSLSTLGSQGGMIDFDVGGTYHVIDLGEFQVHAALAFQNILGGTYSNLPLNLVSLSNSTVPAQPRSMGIGGSVTRAEWWKFTDTTLALESTDIFNNGNGSLFRTIHLGGETHWKSIALRFGLNQGYLCGGVGFDFSFFKLDVATYGEEMGLNAGTLQDRRYTLNFGFHI